MIVEEIMDKGVITAGLNDSISSVATLLSEKGIHGVPVVDDNKKVLGIVTETDFFTKDSSSIHLPSFIDFIKNEKLDKDVKSNKTLNLILESTVKDIMTTSPLTVSPNLPIHDLINIFREKSLKTIPVVDQENNLKGVVTATDIIKLTLKI